MSAYSNLFRLITKYAAKLKECLRYILSWSHTYNAGAMSAHPNLSQLITEYVDKLEECLEQLLPRHPNEAEFRQPIDQLLGGILCCRQRLNPLAHAEYTLATGQADAVFNRLVIEYERPGTLSDKPSHRATAHALDQVKRYLTGLAQQQRHELTRMAGIVFDGRYIIFVRYRMGDFAIDESPVSR
jgi:hypothetical protein